MTQSQPAHTNKDEDGEHGAEADDDSGSEPGQSTVPSAPPAATSNEASAVATNGQIEVDDDSSASVEVEHGSEDKPRPTEEDDVGAGADANVRRGAKCNEMLRGNDEGAEEQQRTPRRAKDSRQHEQRE